MIKQSKKAWDRVLPAIVPLQNYVSLKTILSRNFSYKPTGYRYRNHKSATILINVIADIIEFALIYTKYSA